MLSSACLCIYCITKEDIHGANNYSEIKSEEFFFASPLWSKLCIESFRFSKALSPPNKPTKFTNTHEAPCFLEIFCSPQMKETIYKNNIELGRLGSRGKIDEARKLFDEMPVRDVVSYASMISIYLKNNDLLKAEYLYGAMPERNIVADSAMFHAYAKAGRLLLAQMIFDCMPSKNVFSWWLIPRCSMLMPKLDGYTNIKSSNHVKYSSWSNT